MHRSGNLSVLGETSKPSPSRETPLWPKIVILQVDRAESWMMRLETMPLRIGRHESLFGNPVDRVGNRVGVGL